MSKHKDMTGADLHEPKGVATATNGQVYQADGAGSGTWSSLVIPSGLFNITIASFTSSGTWTKPAGMFMAKVTCIAGGGGSANGGGGGAGGTSSFGTYCIATGGAGSGGTAGIGTTGDLLLRGKVGVAEDTDNADAGLGLGLYGSGGHGSASGPVTGGSGGGAAIKYLYSTTGTVTVTVGAGGTGSTATGNPGLVVIEQYIPV